MAVLMALIVVQDAASEKQNKGNLCVLNCAAGTLCSHQYQSGCVAGHVLCHRLTCSGSLALLARVNVTCHGREQR